MDPVFLTAVRNARKRAIIGYCLLPLVATGFLVSGFTSVGLRRLSWTYTVAGVMIGLVICIWDARMPPHLALLLFCIVCQWILNSVLIHCFFLPRRVQVERTTEKLRRLPKELRDLVMAAGLNDASKAQFISALRRAEGLEEEH